MATSWKLPSAGTGRGAGRGGSGRRAVTVASRGRPLRSGPGVPRAAACGRSGRCVPFRSAGGAARSYESSAVTAAMVRVPSGRQRTRTAATAGCVISGLVSLPAAYSELKLGSAPFRHLCGAPPAVSSERRFACFVVPSAAAFLPRGAAQSHRLAVTPLVSTPDLRPRRAARLSFPLSLHQFSPDVLAFPSPSFIGAVCASKWNVSLGKECKSTLRSPGRSALLTTCYAWGSVRSCCLNKKAAVPVSTAGILSMPLDTHSDLFSKHSLPTSALTGAAQM